MEGAKVHELHKTVAHFGPFELDVHQGELRKTGFRCRLAAQPLQVLALLVENAGEIVEREALRKRLWVDHTFVDFEHSLCVAISKIRMVLGDSADSPIFIETLRGRGYRFISPVEWKGRVSASHPPPVPSSPLSLMLPRGDKADWLRQPGAAAVEPMVHESDMNRKPWQAGSLAMALPPGGQGPRQKRVLPRATDVPKLVVMSLAGGVGLMAAFALLWSTFFHRPSRKGALVRQITAAPPGNPIRGGAISPDGKAVAYVDEDGVHLRGMDGGDARTLALPGSLRSHFWQVTWFPDGERLLVTGILRSATPSSLWSISLFDGSLRRLWNGGDAAVSPDGTTIAYVAPFLYGASGGHSLQIRKTSGGTPTRIAASQVDRFLSPAWSPDGQRIAYIRESTSGTVIESTRVSARSDRIVVLSSPNLNTFIPSLCWTSDWRIVFALSDPNPGAYIANLWQIRLKPHSAVAAGGPTRLTNWQDSAVYGFAPSAEGNQLSFIKVRTPSHGYIAKVIDEARLSDIYRVIHAGGSDWVSDWFPQRGTLLLRVDTNGMSSLYQEELGREPERIISAKQYSGAAVSPDGRWVIYSVPGRSDAAGNVLSWFVMRVAISGGTPQLVLDSTQRININCPHLSGASCVLSEVHSNQSGNSELTFYTFDPVFGKGNEISTIPVEPSTAMMSDGWDISPDGSRIAVPEIIADGLGSAIGIVPVGRRTQQIVKTMKLHGHWNIESVTWAADEKSLFATLWSASGSALAKVEFDGSLRILFQKKQQGLIHWPQLSPDGKYLSFTAQNWQSNLWTLSAF